MAEQWKKRPEAMNWDSSPGGEPQWDAVGATERVLCTEADVHVILRSMTSISFAKRTMKSSGSQISAPHLR